MSPQSSSPIAHSSISSKIKNQLKSLNSKTDISIVINFRYLRLKLLKNKENNKKICHIFHHSFNNIPCYVLGEVSLKRFYFALFDDGLTFKTLKLAFIGIINNQIIFSLFYQKFPDKH